MNTATQPPAPLTDKLLAVLIAIRELQASDISRRPPTQTQIAQRVGISIGTVNWHLKRLRDGGWIAFGANEPRSIRILRRIPRRKTASEPHTPR